VPKLTKRTVDAAAPALDGSRRFVWDSDLKGFGLLVTPAGAKSYVVQYRTEHGRSRRLTIGRHGSPWTPEKARERAEELLRDVAVGADPMERRREARKAETVSELIDLYLEKGPAANTKKKASSWAADRSNLMRHVKPLLGSKVVASLTKEDIEDFQRDVAAGKTAADVKTKARGRAIVSGGKGTAARSTAVLGAMLAFAVERRMIPKNPAAKVTLYEGAKKERFLTGTEAATLSSTMVTMVAAGELNPTAAAAIRLLLLTGCRKSEVLTLKWSYVDLEGGRLNLPDSKTGAKSVPLGAPALSLLGGIERTASGYVFPAARGAGHFTGVQKAWEAVRKRAGLGDVRIHDLRHSFASFAVAGGASLYLVGKVLGHAQAKTTQKYAHLADDPLRAVADATAGKIAGAMAPKDRSGEVVQLKPKAG
jgi:integrase